MGKAPATVAEGVLTGPNGDFNIITRGDGIKQ